MRAEVEYVLMGVPSSLGLNGAKGAEGAGPGPGGGGSAGGGTKPAARQTEVNNTT